MNFSRRELLTASAALLAGSKAAFSGSGQTARAAAEAGAVAGAGTGGKPIVLCWNENPYGPSPAARAVISGTIPGACRYPDEEINQLVELLGSTEGVPADHIVVGSGSGELLCALGLLHGRSRCWLNTGVPASAAVDTSPQHAAS